LEVIYTTGKKYSEQRIGKKAERNFTSIKIGLNPEREKLYQRINQRVDDMMKAGLLEEVKELYTFKKLYTLNTVGYQELFDYIEDKLTLEQAVELIKQNTRNYAKRQLTWFKKDKGIFWYGPDEEAEIIKHIDSILNDKSGENPL
jgi:tRNA dimethylallyltransferase